MNADRRSRRRGDHAALTLDDFDQFAGADAARRTGSSAQIWLIVLAEAVLHDAISARVRAQPTR